MVTDDQVRALVENYAQAWSANRQKDAAALFSPQAMYHVWPYEIDWINRDAINEGRQGRAPSQEGGSDFGWSHLPVIFRKWNNEI